MTIGSVRVLLVEDSPVALAMLRRCLESAPDIQVAGTARNGKEALQKIPMIQPHVICTDLVMDEMDGAELIQKTMARFPCPILVISQAVQEAKTVDRLKALGAVDVFPKPLAIEPSCDSVEALIQKVRVVAGVTVFTKPLSKKPPPPVLAPRSRTEPIEIVGIGLSTGGPGTMQFILSRLPRNYPVPILCTQHIAAGFLDDHVAWLNRYSRLTVSVAKEGEVPAAGRIYYAPESCHLGLTTSRRFWYDAAPPVRSHRPSATRMFEAIASAYGPRALCLLLTGMGNDGASGLLTLARAGGVTAAQDEASSVVFGMPKEAIAIGAAQHIIGLESIPQFLQDCVAP
ncbi:MAG: chemotaxis protein CheB [Cyanobacteria bacterium P01_F01_bin.42]